MREDADVAAITNSDPRVQRGAEAHPLRPNRGWLGLRAAPVTAVLLDRVTRGKRRDETHALVFHEPEYFRRSVVAVFDRLDARYDRASHPLGGRRVRDDWAPT